MSNVFLCDVDGCILKDNTSFAFAEILFEQVQNFKNLAGDYNDGNISQDDAVIGNANLYAQNLAKLKNASTAFVEGKVKEYLKTIKLFAGVEDAFKLLKKNDYDIYLVSGGVDLVIRPLAAKLRSMLGTDSKLEYFATEIPFKNGLYAGESPTDDKCMINKNKAAKINEIIGSSTGRRQYAHTLSAGDSEGDYDMLCLTDSRFIYNPKKVGPRIKGIIDLIVETNKTTWQIYCPQEGGQTPAEIMKNYRALENVKTGTFFDAVKTSLEK